MISSASVGCNTLAPRSVVRAAQSAPPVTFASGVSDAVYRQLAPHIVRQQTDSSCSAAALSVVINALRSSRGLDPITEPDVRRTDPTGRFWASTAAGGNGVDLATLGMLALQAGRRLAGPVGLALTADVVRMPPAKAPHHLQLASTRAFAYVLAQAMQPPLQSAVILNVLQSRLGQGGAPIGHFVLCAAYDERRERVLVIDIDDEDGLAPFWLPLPKLVRAMQADGTETGEPRVYLWLQAST